MKPTQAVLFDLDGTLLDTAADIATAFNQLLIEENILPLDLPTIRAGLNYGSEYLLNISMHITPQDVRYPILCKRFFQHYKKYLTYQTCLFSGVETVLAYLDQKNIPWGIVTNKPHQFTLPLLTHLRLETRTKCIVSGDTLSHAKPHPAPLHYACKLLNFSPNECIYVGDAETDILASRKAGMRVLFALYGYISKTDNPHDWQADGYLHTPTDLMQWI